MNTGTLKVQIRVVWFLTIVTPEAALVLLWCA
jgi:hypothetical protein